MEKIRLARFLCLFLSLQLSCCHRRGTEESNQSSDRRSLSGNLAASEVELIQCNGASTQYSSILAVELDGQLGNSASELGSAIMDSFKTDSAVQCDPHQRNIVNAQFNQLYANAAMGNDVALYQISVTSYGTTQFGTAMDPPSPIFEASTKVPLRQLCSVSQVLDSQSTSCPRDGCYCPDSLLSARKTAGVTEKNLASTLNDTVLSCQAGGNRARRRKAQRLGKSTATIKPKLASNPGTAAGSDPVFPDVDDGPSKSKSKSKSKTAPVNPIQTSVTVGPITTTTTTATVSEQDTTTCLPFRVRGVSELRQMQPCQASSFSVFQFDMVTILSVDPCTVGQDTLTRFLDRLTQVYNSAQVHKCDSSHRQIQSVYLKNVCSNRGLRELYSYSSLFGPNALLWGGMSFSSDEQTTTDVNLGRRRLNRDAQPYEVGKKNKDSKTSVIQGYRRMSSVLPTLGSPLCLCSAFANQTTGGLTNDEFTALANKTIQEFYPVQVLNQFEVENCPSQKKRYNLTGLVAVTIKKDVDSLTPQDFANLAAQCAKGYNAFTVEECPASYPILSSCTVEKFYEDDTTNRNRGRRRLSVNNVLLFQLFGTSGSSDESFFTAADIGRRNLAQSGSTNKASSFSGLFQSNGSPNDQCVCQVGQGTGLKPTVAQFASIINVTGIVEYALEVEELPACGTPQAFRQTIQVAANGQMDKTQVQSKLEEVIQNSLNQLSIEQCAKHHFYVYAVQLVSKTMINDGSISYVLNFDLDFVAFGTTDQTDDILYKVDRSAIDNFRALAPRPLDMSQREINAVTAGQNYSCYGAPGVNVSDFISLTDLNQRLYDTISAGAAAGVVFAKVTPCPYYP